VPGADIGDPETRDQDGTILVTVDHATSRYTVTFGSSTTHAFSAKAPAAPVPALASVVITSLLPNPSGDDAQLEEVTLTNKGGASVSLVGWSLADRSGLTWTLDGSVAAGQSRTLRRNGQPMSLNNAGDEIGLFDETNAERDRYSYAASVERTVIETGH
jgi:hypothetical protein